MEPILTMPANAVKPPHDRAVPITDATNHGSVLTSSRECEIVSRRSDAGASA